MYEAGFPFFQLDRFLKTLVLDLNKYVAISEEFPNNAAAKVKSGGLLFDRKVTRVVTPGTLVDEKFMDPYENNFLLAVSLGQPDYAICAGRSEVSNNEVAVLAATTSVGLAWLDLSTGEFYTQNTTFGGLPSAIARIGAREIVLDDSISKDVQHNILTILGHQGHLVTWRPSLAGHLPIAAWTPMLESPVPVAEEALFSREEIVAGSIVINYVRDRLQGLGIRLQHPMRRQEAENMVVDRNSLRGLEILETTREGVAGGKGSLLHAVRRTATKSGARLLRDRIGKLWSVVFLQYIYGCSLQLRRRRILIHLKLRRLHL